MGLRCEKAKADNSTGQELNLPSQRYHPAEVRGRYLDGGRADERTLFLPAQRAYLALGVFLAAMAFWYGGGLVRAAGGWIWIQKPFEIFLGIAFFLVAVCLAYTLGNRTGGHAATAPTQPSGPQSISHFRIFFACMVLVGVSILGHRLGGMWAYHAARVLPIAGIIAGVLLFGSAKGFKFVYLSIFLVTIALSTEAYSRRIMLTILAAPAILLVLRAKLSRSIVTRISVGVAVALAGVVFVTGLRGFEWHGDPAQIGLIMARGADVISRGIGFDTVTLFDYVLSVYPDRYPYLNGGSLWGALVNPIPRSLWADKPIAFGITLASEYFLVPPSDVPTNFGPGVVAEAYANGGYLAVLVAGAALGYLLARLDRLIVQKKHDVLGQTLIVIALPCIFFLVRGDFLNVFYELYIKLIPAALVVMFSTRGAPVLAKPASVSIALNVKQGRRLGRV